MSVILCVDQYGNNKNNDDKISPLEKKHIWNDNVKAGS